MERGGPVEAIARTPAPSFVTGCQLTFVERRPPDLEGARRQHAAYRRALEEAGVRVRLLEPLDAFPDSVFVEDTAVVLPEGVVLARPGAPTRRGEVDAVVPALPGDRPTGRIEAPATLEGGDVLPLGRTLFVGLSTRTDARGAEALARAVRPWGYRVKPVELGRALHLKTACTAVGEATVLVDPSRIDPAAFAPADVVEVEPGEGGAANVVRLPGRSGGDTLVASASWPRTVERLRERGHRVRTVPLDELEKAEAGPTCLSLLVPPVPA